MGEKDVRVGIADLNLVLPPDTIMTIGLGSCIGISIYDKELKIAGLAHIMLPDSTQFKVVSNPFKFADLAIPILLQKMLEKGSIKRNLIAKIVGGASMFNFSDAKIISDIGKRNVESVKDVLNNREGIKIVAEETGGKKGRTMIVDPENGEVTIKTVGEAIFTI